MQRIVEKKDDEYKNIFKFISNNKTLPALITSIKPDDEKAIQLLKALTSGDYHAEIFSDAECHVYLLYLIEQKKISLSVGMTAYGYLMALMQFTDKQPLRVDDQDEKTTRQITIDSLVKSGELTKVGQQFIKKLCERFAALGYVIDKEKLQTFILQLSPIEQGLTKVPYVEVYGEAREKLHDADRISIPLRANMPFLIDEDKLDKTSKEKGYYWVPSVTLVNYLLHEINKNPIEMYPIFGTIGLSTLRKLHESGLHPVSLYSPYIKSNPKNADTYRCGPFYMWLHDLGHTFWGSLLETKERDFIFNHFIPQMELLKKEAQDHKDNEVVTSIDNIINQVCDFDLTGQSFASKSGRLPTYLNRPFKLYPFIKVEFENIGACKEDRLYFLLKKMYYSTNFTSFSDKMIWSEIFSRFTTHQYYRRAEVITALDILAKTAAVKTLSSQDQFSWSEYVSDEIKWSKWLKILDTAKSSTDIWQMVMADYERRSELSALAYHHKIAFFEPYLPLTSEKQQQLRILIKEKTVEQQRKMDQQYRHSDHFSFYRMPSRFDQAIDIMKDGLSLEP